MEKGIQKGVPYDNLCNRIILYGFGKRGKRLYDAALSASLQIAGIIDRDKSKSGDYVGSQIISDADVLADRKDTYLCVTIADTAIRNEVIRSLMDKYEVAEERFIDYNYLFGMLMLRNKELLKNAETVSKSDHVSNRIFFGCLHGLGLGGIESWTINITNELERKKQQSIGIVTDSREYDVDEAVKKRVYKIDVNEKEFKEQVLKCIDFLAANLPCTIISSQPDAFLYAAKYLKDVCLDKIKIITVIHGGTDRIYNTYSLFINVADFMIGVSKDIATAMISRGLDRGKCLYMTIPFDCPRILDRSYSKIENERLRIGYAGRIDVKQKRSDLLILLVECLEKAGINYDLSIAGDGPYLPKLTDALKRYGDRIKILGKINRDDMADFWKNRDVCINISDYEGRSISVIEAMGSGAVPIVTDTSGVRDDIFPPKNGFIVPIGDYQAMVDKIQFLDENRSQIEEMGQKAHDEVYQKSLMSEHIYFWESIFERLGVWG